MDKRNYTGEISASRTLGANAWMFTRTTESRKAKGGTRCVIIGVRTYEARDVVAICDWLHERACGYPKRELR